MCSCIPPPASIRARKYYNPLTEHLFFVSTVKSSSLDAPVPASTQRAITKLHEYLNHTVKVSPAYASKISRRLTRRIKKALYHGRDQLGIVRIAVKAYQYFLDKSTDENAHYSFTYFSKELVQQPDDVIKSLLTYPHHSIQGLGAELLASYIRAQDGFDHQAEINAALMARVLELGSLGSAAAAGLNPKDADGAGSTTASSSGRELQLACLHAAHEYIAFCQRAKIPPELLEQLEVLVLSCLERSPVQDPAVWQEMAEAAASSPMQARAPAPSGVSHPVTRLAVQIFLQFRPFMQDVGSVRRVMRALMAWLDESNRWDKPQLVQGLIGLMRFNCTDMFPLMSALMRHSGHPGLSTTQRATIVKLAMEQGTSYSLSAFSCAMTELPRALAAAGASATDGEAQQLLQTTALSAVTSLAKDVGDATQLCEAIAGGLRSYAEPSAASLAALRCVVEALGAMVAFPEAGRYFSNRMLPGSLLQQLVIMACTWDGEGEGSHRSLALRAATELLPCVDGPLRDERQALLLLSLVHGVAGLRPSEAAQQLPAVLSPQDWARLSRLAAGAVGSGKPGVVLEAARLALALQVEGAVRAAGGAAAAGPPAWSAAGLLLLAHALAAQVGDAAECSQLKGPQLCASPAATNLVSLLRLQLQPAPAALVAGSGDWGSDAAAAGAAAAALSSGGSNWGLLLVGALCTESSLRAEFGDRLHQLLHQPFASVLPPVSGAGGKAAGPGAAAMIMARATLPLGHMLMQQHSQSQHNGSPSHRPAAAADAAGEQAAQGGLEVESAAAQPPVPAALPAGLAPWALRSASIGHDQVQLSFVVDMLAAEASSKGEGHVAGTGGAGAATGHLLAHGSAAPSKPLSVQQALQLVSSLPLQPLQQQGRVRGHSAAAAHVMAAVRELEPLVH